jgi:preprotein translocase subunit SecD
MKVCARQFNLYLALGTALTLLGGCQTNKSDEKVSALRVHIEVNADNAGDLSTAQTISVLRSTPVAVTIEQDPVLTEANVVAAKVVELPGGFAIEVKFDETATWTLEQYSAANPGKHFAIFGQWSEKVVDGRWLAAPIINHRIGNGVLAFTPDASREEADQLVLGLNNAAKKTRAGTLK